MTPLETDDGDLAPTTRERFRQWSDQPASATNGRLLLSRVLWTVFLAFSAWVGIRQIQLDNEVTRERVDDALLREVADCHTANDRRDEGKQVALGDVKADQDALSSDLASWQSIDELFPDGLPEPALTTVFTGLAARQIAIENQRELIDEVYEADPCPEIPAGDVGD